MVGFLAFTTGLLLGMIAMAVIFYAVCMDRLNDASLTCELAAETMERYLNEKKES